MSEKSASKEDKLFGRYHELVLVLVAFFLTTICGGLLGFYFQNRGWERQHRDNVLQSEKESAEKVFSEISQLIDTRMYKMRRVFWGYKFELGKNEIKDRWVEYENTLDAWNGTLNKNLALLQRYFGNNARAIFESQIHGEFRHWGSELEKFRNFSTIRKDELSKIDQGLDELNNIFYRYDLELLIAIRDENIGQFIKKEMQFQ